jgi:ABC-2 type transport system ATP-binding protein
MSNIIEVNQLVKRYPGSDQPAVRGLSFAVRRGEIFGLLGPAGAGKTTTLLLLAGLLQPESGTITVAGGNLSRRSSDHKRLVRMVPQKITRLPWLSLQNNLLGYGWLHGLRGAGLKAHAAEAMTLVGLDDCRSADQQSLDTQQRVSLAAALLLQPEILLFDAPTSNIEVARRDTFLKIVTEINRRGVTIVYATRDGEEAAHLCHRVALIDRGRIVALDTPRALQTLRGNGAAPESLDAALLELTGKLRRE